MKTKRPSRTSGDATRSCVPWLTDRCRVPWAKCLPPPISGIFTKRGWAFHRKWSSGTSRTQTRPQRAAPQPRTSLLPDGQGQTFATSIELLFCLTNVAETKSPPFRFASCTLPKPLLNDASAPITCSTISLRALCCFCDGELETSKRYFGEWNFQTPDSSFHFYIFRFYSNAKKNSERKINFETLL